MKKVLIGIGVVVGLFFLSAIVAGVAGAGKGSDKDTPKQTETSTKVSSSKEEQSKEAESKEKDNSSSSSSISESSSQEASSTPASSTEAASADQKEALQNLITNWTYFKTDLSGFPREYIVKHLQKDLAGKNFDLTMVGFAPDSLPVTSGNTLANFINEAKTFATDPNTDETSYQNRINEMIAEATTQIQQLKDLKASM
ncbi:hypothetical protein EGW53_09250 [Enterococcus faecium]|uniref:hypothetical protein n=1 Tax=Enterococcus faecium TaxID=1352 RepID=UPI000F507A38|nr:hypothetical protein [Enterococcus faecium]EMF0154916.1 hypothetical protein [Enterococcus hirae]ROW95148.1 hypothetical protein EGW09_10365 [Enterococcus faecium]ROX48176.1 hypothetical protein EGW18_10365 [Enterococcus faecium]ROX51311.1 hypothetical protein EGW14_09250 [Enterococcus faecium]ROY06256.1 hypothetical protein EGW53_09250 [Enterococcus faecium]